MALTERNRNVLYQGLTQAIGDEEAVEAMLSQFPARDVDEPATKDFVRAEIGELRVDMTTRFGDSDRRISDAVDELKTYIHEELRRYFLWSYGAMFALLAAVVTAAKILE